MTWPCFLIEPCGSAIEFVVGHRVDGVLHREVVEHLDGVRFEERPEAPSGGWLDACPRCGAAIAFDGEWDDGWRTTVGLTKWRHPDTGQESTRPSDFGAGAMYDITDHSPEEWRGPDGRSYAVICPPGDEVDAWHIDAPSSTGGRWTRTGKAPNLTVSPSILTPRYHGFLRDGVLTDSLPDRPLPPAIVEAP